MDSFIKNTKNCSLGLGVVTCAMNHLVRNTNLLESHLLSEDVMAGNGQPAPQQPKKWGWGKKLGLGLGLAGLGTIGYGIANPEVAKRYGGETVGNLANSVNKAIGDVKNSATSAFNDKEEQRQAKQQPAAAAAAAKPAAQTGATAPAAQPAGQAGAAVGKGYGAANDPATAHYFKQPNGFSKEAQEELDQVDDISADLSAGAKGAKLTPYTEWQSKQIKNYDNKPYADRVKYDRQHGAILGLTKTSDAEKIAMAQDDYAAQQMEKTKKLWNDIERENHQVETDNYAEEHNLDNYSLPKLKSQNNQQPPLTPSTTSQNNVPSDTVEV